MTSTDRRGIARSIRLFRAFLVEQSAPEHFYSVLAQDTVGQLADYQPLAGRTVVDVGGGAGYFATAVRAQGADYYLIEPDQRELAAANGKAGGHCGPCLIGDGHSSPRPAWRR